jgi:hypothetical protein
MYIMFKGELKIVSPAYVNKYLHNGKSKVRVDVNNSREKLKKKSLMLELQKHSFKGFGFNFASSELRH